MLRHFKRIEGNNRLHDDLHGSDGPLLVSDPGHIDDVSRWFVQALQAMGEPSTTTSTARRNAGSASTSS